MDGYRNRRRSPLWVRQLDRHKLHGLAGKLRRDFCTVGLTPAQDWLLDACLSELAWRRRHTAVWMSCSCDLCCSPFDDVFQAELPGDDTDWMAPR